MKEVQYVDEFSEIMGLQHGPVKYETGKNNNTGLVMTQHNYPMSITDNEFYFLKDLVERYGLKNGYEVGTAFGISTIAAGLGFKKTGGKLITIDSYVEEVTGDYFSYRRNEPETYKDSDGWKSVNFLIDHFKLKDIITPEVGWSPNNVDEILTKHKISNLDYVFIDGGHFPEQIIKDIEVVLPYLNKKFVFVFHDYFLSEFTEPVLDFINENFGKLPEVKVPQPYGCNIATIVKQ